MHTVRCIVHGRVQGVFFRDSTRRLAESLGVHGHAVNLPDGGVEVVARGAEEAVATLKRWLRQGPPQARVDSVACEPLAADVADGFRVG